jgi:hypothetical protein
MVERRSNKKDSAILIQYEKVREGDIVKLKDFYNGEFKIGRTTGFSESIFYYTSRKIKDLLTGDYVALYKFDFIEPLSEIEEAMFENDKYNLEREVEILDVGFMRVIEINE